jgi:RNA polymerase sigma factor (sigma-70 family)
MDNNDFETYLLNEKPNELIVKYQPMIKIIVSKFIRSGYIHTSEMEDFVQIINEKLILKIPKIQSQYDKSTLLKTYFSVIIRNICLEEIRKNKDLETKEIDDSEETHLSENNSDTKIIIKQEFERFNKILRLQFDKRFKLEFCLKALYRILLILDDFTKYCKICKLEDIKVLLERINPPKKISERDLYAEIKPFINKCDNKDNSSDAIRKWIKKEINNIIDLMNGGYLKRTNYDKETIQILIEKYYNEYD